MLGEEAEIRNSVLIVDDDEGIRSLLEELLDGAGYDVVTASHGIAALELLRQGPLPGVILLDLMMPKMDGWAFRREQRADPRIAGVPIIVTTAVSREEQDLNTLRAVAYLEKPFNLKLLLHLVSLYSTPRQT